MIDPSGLYFRPEGAGFLCGIAPPEVTYKHMYLGIIPFVACQGLTLLVVFLMPWTATWLPKISGGF